MTREATDDTMAMIREAGQGGLRGVMHCFSGTVEDARAALDLGFYLSFAGILTFPKALQFLIYVGGTSLVTIFTPTSYLRLIILMILAFGVAFEFPILLVFLELAGVLTSRRLSSWRRQAIVVIFIVTAVITPSQDPFSLFAMAIPMCLFYEGAILVGRLLKR